MKKITSVKIIALLLSFITTNSSIAQQSIRFTNVVPEVNIPLRSNSIQVTTTGSIIAQCQTSTQTGSCQGVNVTGSTTINPNAPTVSITGTPNGSPLGSGNYLNGTIYTITPSVTNASACVREYGVGSQNSATWSGSIVSNFNTAVAVTLPTSGFWSFKLTCFNMGGGTTSQTVSITTEGDPPPSGACTTQSPHAPSGFTRSVSPTEFSTWSGGNSFPFSGTALKNITASNGKYTSIGFTTPSNWDATSGYTSFVFDEGQTVDPASVTDIYMTISLCEGDFRTSTPTGDQNDPASNAACRNWRGGSNYFTSFYFSRNGVSDAVGCGLKPNTRYFLNYINANPENGIQNGEHTCTGGAFTCGVQGKFLN